MTRWPRLGIPAGVDVQGIWGRWRVEQMMESQDSNISEQTQAKITYYLQIFFQQLCFYIQQNQTIDIFEVIASI